MVEDRRQEHGGSKAGRMPFYELPKRSGAVPLYRARTRPARPPAETRCDVSRRSHQFYAIIRERFTAHAESRATTTCAIRRLSRTFAEDDFLCAVEDGWRVVAAVEEGFVEADVEGCVKTGVDVHATGEGG